jgi:hypothetical protein
MSVPQMLPALNFTRTRLPFGEGSETSSALIFLGPLKTAAFKKKSPKIILLMVTINFTTTDKSREFAYQKFDLARMRLSSEVHYVTMTN